MANEFDTRKLIEEAELIGFKRWVPPVVVVGVLAVFMSLAWYAYHSETQSLKDDGLLVVEADKTPIKEKPLDPGGMQFPDQDKTVFDTFGGEKAQQLPKVETILPAPEEPLHRDEDTSGTVTWINEKLHKPKPAEQPASEPAAKQEVEQVIGTDGKKPTYMPPGPIPAVQPVPKPKPRVLASSIVPGSALGTSSPPVAAAHTAENATPAVSAPKMTSVQPKPASEAKAAPEPKPTPEKKVAQEPKTVAATTPAVKNAGRAKIQLGAYRSEKEAREAWGKIQKKHTQLADRQPVIVKANLGAQGIYYRLRVGGFENGAVAKTFCSKLTAGGQACMVAEK